MLMILTPSVPSVTNTTTQGDQPVALSWNDHRLLEEPFIQIGEVETTMFGDVGQPLRFIPNDLHMDIS